MAKSTRIQSRSVKPPQFAEQARLVLPGSEKSAAPNAVHVKATPARSMVTVSVIVKRNEPLKVNRRGGRANGPARVSATEYKKRHGGDPDAIKQVKAFAREFNLKVEPDPTAALRRTVKLTGTAADIQKAFGSVLEQKRIDGVEYRVREGGIHLPASLVGVVEAVLGLDNRPQAQPHFRVHRALAKAAAPSSYTPPQVAKAYNFPAKASGAGQTIGIIELGGGYRQADLKAYFKSLGLSAPGITAVSVDGGKNKPSTASSADGEVMLDIAAAGDDGATDGGKGNNVDFPASSPHVLACGGTKLDANGATIVSEVVWNELANQEGATGGGVSNVFALPSWQANAHVPASSTAAGGRGVPDVAGDADPATGYEVRVDGQTSVIGGTSAVAPLWAGLVAVANQQLGTKVGFLQPAIYAAKAASAFNDITQGNNGTFKAGPGWDACTGLGTPITNKLIPLLALASKGSKGSSKQAVKAVKKAQKKAARKSGR